MKNAELDLRNMEKDKNFFKEKDDKTTKEKD